MSPQVCTAPIFVVGTPRSGTTLMAKVLGRHSGIFMPGETHYFEDIFSRRNELGPLTSPEARRAVVARLYTIYERYYEEPDQARIESIFPSESDLAEALGDVAGYGDVLQWFMGVQMERAGKTRWGNNAPRDLFHIDEIKSLYPGAKFVICVRDIRAFLVSYKGKWKIVEGDHHIARMKKLYHPVVTSLLWKSSMKKAQSACRRLGEGDCTIVRYEDMVRDPEQTVRKVCRILGEEFQPGMLEVESSNSSHSAEQDPGIFSSSVDKWKTSLSAEEIRVGQVVGGSELAWLGYHRETVRVSPGKLIWTFVTTPYAFAKALWANREVTGPIIPYLTKRIWSLVSG